MCSLHHSRTSLYFHYDAWEEIGDVNVFILVIDRYWFFRTDTDYVHVYVPANRYSEPIFIYCYKVDQ